MLICRLKNGAIVPLREVLNVKKQVDNLLNDLFDRNDLSFSRKLPFSEMINKVKSDQYVITNNEVRNILIYHGFLDGHGLMSGNMRDIIQSGYDGGLDISFFHNPVSEIIGDLNLQASL